MIQVSDSQGMTRLVNPVRIIDVTEAGASSQWHGTRSFIKTDAGTTIECAQTVDEVRKRIDKAHQASLLMEGKLAVPIVTLWGVVGSTGHARKKHVDALRELLEAAKDGAA